MAALLADDNKFGFIVMDGNGALFGVLSGNSRDVLHKFTVDLPKKHGQDSLMCFNSASWIDFFVGRGGQSALRFARLRMEKRHNYVRKVAETVTQLFITNDKASDTISVHLFVHLFSLAQCDWSRLGWFRRFQNGVEPIRFI